MVSSRKLNHGKVQLTESFEKLADNKISIHELMDDLQNDCFKSPSELEALKLVQRYLEPESQMSFSSKCPRIPTRPRIVQIRLQPNDKGFQSLQNIALNVFCRHRQCFLLSSKSHSKKKQDFGCVKNAQRVTCVFSYRMFQQSQEVSEVDCEWETKFSVSMDSNCPAQRWAKSN